MFYDIFTKQRQSFCKKDAFFMTYFTETLYGNTIYYSDIDSANNTLKLFIAIF